MAFFVCHKTNLNKTAKKRFHTQWVSFIPPKKCKFLKLFPRKSVSFCNYSPEKV